MMIENTTTPSYLGMVLPANLQPPYIRGGGWACLVAATSPGVHLILCASASAWGQQLSLIPVQC